MNNGVHISIYISLYIYIYIIHICPFYALCMYIYIYKYIALNTTHTIQIRIVADLVVFCHLKRRRGFLLATKRTSRGPGSCRSRRPARAGGGQRRRGCTGRQHARLLCLVAGGGPRCFSFLPAFGGGECLPSESTNKCF